MNLQSLKKFFPPYGAFAKNSLFLFCGSLIVNVSNYIYHLVIGRQVSASVYGEAEALISLITIISVPAMTLTMVATKYAAACKANGDKSGSREIWTYLNKKVFRFGAPIFLVVVFFTPKIGKFLNVEDNFALILIWVSMYLSFFNAINTGLLSGWQKFKKVSLASVASSSVKLFSGIVLVSAGFALSGIVGSLVMATVALYLVTFAALRLNVIKKPLKGVVSCEARVDFKSLKKFILPVFIGNLAITILGNADMVLAKHNLDALSAGQYGALTVVSKIIFFATGIIASVLFSMSAEHSHKGESSRHILKVALLSVLGASAFATLIYFLYPAFILGLIFGSKYQNAAPYLGWFAVAVALFSVSNVIFQYLLSIHKTEIAYPLLTISLLMLLLIVIFGGSIGAIIAIVIISQVVSIIAGIFYLMLGEKSDCFYQ